MEQLPLELADLVMWWLPLWDVARLMGTCQRFRALGHGHLEKRVPPMYRRLWRSLLRYDLYSGETPFGNPERPSWFKRSDWGVDAWAERPTRSDVSKLALCGHMTAVERATANNSIVAPCTIVCSSDVKWNHRPRWSVRAASRRTTMYTLRP